MALVDVQMKSCGKKRIGEILERGLRESYCEARLFYYLLLRPMEELIIGESNSPLGSAYSGGGLLEQFTSLTPALNGIYRTAF